MAIAMFITEINRVAVSIKLLVVDPKSSSVKGWTLDSDLIIGGRDGFWTDGRIVQCQSHIDVKTIRPQPDDLIRSSPQGRPFQLTAGPIFPTNDFRQRIPTPDTVQKPESIPNVTFPTRVRAHHDCERPQS